MRMKGSQTGVRPLSGSASPPAAIWLYKMIELTYRRRSQRTHDELPSISLVGACVEVDLSVAQVRRDRVTSAENGASLPKRLVAMLLG